MVSLGVCSVFELLRETQSTHPVLCHRALVSLLNILQAQSPEGLRNEPADIIGISYTQSPLQAFPRNFPIDGEVANLLAASCCNGIWEMTRYNRHNGPTCYRLVVDLSFMLRTCYWEVANLLWTCYMGKLV